MSCKEKDITIEILGEFEKEFRRLSRKYRSLPQDVKFLMASITEDPTQGVSLGHNLHKVCLAITSKGKGKSGGARVITQVIINLSSTGLVRFVTIYDKSERSTITDKELVALLKENGLA